MPIATTNQVAVRIVEEAIFGTTPASPALKGLRFTSEGLIASKETAVSEVIRVDRQRDFLAEVAASAEGDLGLEPAFGDELDLELEGVLMAAFEISHTGSGDASGTQTLTTAAPVDATVDGGTITRSAGDFLADGFTVGQLVDLAGTTTEDGRYRIQAVTATVITVDPVIGDAPLAVDVGAAAETLTNSVMGIDVVDAARTFQRDDAGDFAADGFVAGQWIRFAGFTVSSGVNNGIYRIETVVTDTITVEAGFGNEVNMVDETGSGDEEAFVKKITNGTVLRSYTVEKEFSDITQFQTFEGMRFANMSLAVETGSIVTATMNMSGEGNVQMAATRSTLPTAGATVVDPDTTDQLNATSNVGNLFEGGVALTTCIQSINLTVENNLRNVNCVGSKFPQEVNPGFVDVTGTLAASFEDAALFTKFVNHTESSLVFSFTDSDGNVIVVTLPRIFYSTGSPVTSGGNEEVELSMEFTAIRESVTGGKTIEFDVLPAVLP